MLQSNLSARATQTNLFSGPAPPVFQAFWKQRGLTSIDSLNEAPHPILPQIARESYRENQNRRCIFTQAGSFATGAAGLACRFMSASAITAADAERDLARLGGRTRCGLPPVDQICTEPEIDAGGPRPPQQRRLSDDAIVLQRILHGIGHIDLWRRNPILKAPLLGDVYR
jgi:hypothetical protein